MRPVSNSILQPRGSQSFSHFVVTKGPIERNTSKLSEKMLAHPTRRVNAKEIGSDSDTLNHYSVNFSEDQKEQIYKLCQEMVQHIRSAPPELMEAVLDEYGLDTPEGRNLILLSEAYLRTPDTDTIYALIQDKISTQNWSDHLGKARDVRVEGLTFALMLAQAVLNENRDGFLGKAGSYLGVIAKPIISQFVYLGMKLVAKQFVIGQTIEEAIFRSKTLNGYKFSFDMLAEGAVTYQEADKYFQSYQRAIAIVSQQCELTHDDDLNKNSEISIKLSALHPRYEMIQKKSVMEELVPKVIELCKMAKESNMGITIDAEEQDRLPISLDVIEAVFKEKSLDGWPGLGVVVQAFGKNAEKVIDDLDSYCEKYDRKINIRLVKGAYRDYEIINAQNHGLPGFPVFENKEATDVNFINMMEKIHNKKNITLRVATHNAQTLATALVMAKAKGVDLEVQRLQGMGERVHQFIRDHNLAENRIYAPVGCYKELLPYLLRRWLENGDKNSFVNQVIDRSVPNKDLCEPPSLTGVEVSPFVPGDQLFPNRKIKGHDPSDPKYMDDLTEEIDRYYQKEYAASEILARGEDAGNVSDIDSIQTVRNPANLNDIVGFVQNSSPESVNAAVSSAQIWKATPEKRRNVLLKVADLIEDQTEEVLSLIMREAGRTRGDALDEIKELVDFCRYYANYVTADPPVGIVAAIGPWNFPAAIFGGQVAAALAAGNGVIAKPAYETPIIASLIIEIFHKAGIPKKSLQLVLGGADIGNALVSEKGIDQVAFTGSTETYRKIRKSMINNHPPGMRIVAEAGGYNSAIVDSTVLIPRTVSHIMHSAFGSAGQRCSAVRLCAVNEHVFEEFKVALLGAIQTQNVGDPFEIETDIGPVINKVAVRKIKEFVQLAKISGAEVYEFDVPSGGNYVSPTVIVWDNYTQIESFNRADECFGPVLNLVKIQKSEEDDFIQAVNRSGANLTFGVHSQRNWWVENISKTVDAGNVYINTKQIGAEVERTPFGFGGGTGESGSGPKAGGPWSVVANIAQNWKRTSHKFPKTMDKGRIEDEFNHQVLNRQVTEISQLMPGALGAISSYIQYTGRPILCLGPGEKAANEQADQVRNAGGHPVVFTGFVTPDQLQEFHPDGGIGGVMWWGDDSVGTEYSRCLLDKYGMPQLFRKAMPNNVQLEKTVFNDVFKATGAGFDVLGSPNQLSRSMKTPCSQRSSLTRYIASSLPNILKRVFK